MSVSLADRCLMLFVLEVGWFLAVLQLIDVPLLKGANPVAVVLVLGLGAVGLALAVLRGPYRPDRATRICRSAGIASFAIGLFCSVTSSGRTASAVALTCLGLILAVTGMKRMRRSPGPGT